MNNGASLNSSTINGWRGDTTVRIQVLSYAIAQGVVIGRVFRRSPMVGDARALGGEGRVWRRSTVDGVAQASPVVEVRVWRLVRELIESVSQASSVITAIGKPITHLREVTVGRAIAAMTSIGGRRWSRLILSANAQADATIKARAFRRSVVACEAAAVGVIDNSIYRRIPWDEAAPSGRSFTVPAGVRIFYVVS